MENLLPNELEELTLCNCCHLTFNDSDALPKLFSCRHYFCLKCVSTILLKGKELYCMHCWKRTELLQPDMKPENLPTYNAILYLSQNMMNIKTKNMINSTGDKNQYSSTNNNNNNNNKIRLNENCLTHAMPNSLWCLKCNILVCRACASTEDHRNHTVKSLNEAKESIHSDILSDLIKMQKKLSDLQHLVFKQRDFLLKILEGCTILKTQIETELINHIPTLEISDIRGNLSKAKVTLTLLEHQQSPAEAHKLLTSLHIEKQRLQSKYNEMSLQCKLEDLIQQYGSLLDFELLKQMSNTITNGNIETLNLNNNSINNNNTSLIAKSPCENIKNLTINNNNIIHNNNNNNTSSTVNCNNRVVINSGHNNMILLLANYCISQLYTHHIQTTKTINQLTQLNTINNNNNNNNNNNMNNNNNININNNNNTGIGGIASMPEQYQLAIPENHHKYPDMAISPSNSFMQTNDLFGNMNNNNNNGSFQTGNGGFNQQQQQHQQQQQQQQQQQHHPTPPPNNNNVPFISDLSLNGISMPIAIMQHHHHMQQHSNIHHIQQSVANTTIATTNISPSITATSNANKSANTIVQNPTVHVYPIYYFNIEINGNPFGRILIEVRNDVAPKMAKNFGALCTRELGFGYKGCNIFQCWENESIITGDFELNNGRGGRSVFEDSFFMPDDTKILAIRGSVGMRRSQKRHDNMGLVGSQFRIILREMRGFTGIFAFVVEGLDLVDKISKAGDSAGKPQSNVIIVNCGKWQ